MLKNNNAFSSTELKFLTENKKTLLYNKHLAAYNALLEDELIPVCQSSNEVFRDFYIPFADWLSRQTAKPLLTGINGAQGAGKSTFSKIVKQLLTDEYQLSTIIISIDDLYLTRQQRKQRSKTIHPLLLTRGVPGTHDVELGLNILHTLKHNFTAPVLIPTFNKATDERNNQAAWQTVNQQPDIILFEGWCVGAAAEKQESLDKPINSLERDQDSKIIWRNFVNTQLKTHYKKLFSEIDLLIMLKIPDFKKVAEWRNLQETKLKQSAAGNNHIMNKEEVNNFTMYFERITRNMLNQMPATATWVLDINEQHQIERARYNK